MTGVLAGRVVAFVCAGDARDREIAVACAEAGADIALGTAMKDHEFAVASIANEVWAIGREHFVRVMDATDPAAVASFADEVWDRLGRCDGLVVAAPAGEAAELDEISHEAFIAGIERGLVAPFLATQAFGRLMERAHGGEIILLGSPDRRDLLAIIAAEGLRGIFAAGMREWGRAGVSIRTSSNAVRGEVVVGWLNQTFSEQASSG